MFHSVQIQSLIFHPNTKHKAYMLFVICNILTMYFDTIETDCSVKPKHSNLK